MSRYPSIYAGQRLTGTLLQSMMPDIIVKNTNEDRPSTTTLANDTDLVATLEANAVYHVVMYVHFAALDAAGFQTQWAIPVDGWATEATLGAVL